MDAVVEEAAAAAMMLERLHSMILETELEAAEEEWQC